MTPAADPTKTAIDMAAQIAPMIRGILLIRIGPDRTWVVIPG